VVAFGVAVGVVGKQNQEHRNLYFIELVVLMFLCSVATTKLEHD